MASPAASIVEKLGGPENISTLTHCATRLRFELKDAALVDKAAVEAIPGVMGAVPQSGNRYQVVIGGGVQGVYNDITNLPSMKGRATAKSDADVKAELRAAGPRGKYAWVDNFFEYLSDSFRPLLGVLLGASLIIAFAAVLDALKIVDFRAADKPASWVFVDTMWRAVFYFLPIMVAYNAAKKLDVDPWLGATIMGALMTPEFGLLSKAADTVCTKNPTLGTEACVAQVFGLPMQLNGYGGQVFVPLIMVAALAPLYKLLKKIFPENLQMVFVPFISMIIMIPLTAFLLGPLGVWAGTGIGAGLAWLNSHAPIVFAILIPLLYPFLVPLGLHWPLNALMLLNIQTLGYDFIQGPMGAWNFACFGATAGVLFLSMKEKDAAMRQTSFGALVAGLLGGISEPSLYGIHLRFKRIYPLMLVGCLTGGLIVGLLGGVTTQAFAFTSLLTIPVFDPMWKYALSVTAAFLVAMILVIVFDYRTKEQKAEALALAGGGTVPVTATDADAVTAERTATGVDTTEADDPSPSRAAGTTGATAAAHGATTDAAAATAASTTTTATTTVPAKASKAALQPGATTRVAAPLSGTVVPLAEVPDPVFAAGTVGKGVGILPDGNTVVAPAPGKVLVAHSTGHALGLALDSGIELLIHVGIDTVNLDGKGFDVHVKAGDRVEAGTPLVTFDRSVIEAAGYSLVTPVLVTNAKKFGSIEPIATGHVQAGTDVLQVRAKDATPTA